MEKLRVDVPQVVRHEDRRVQGANPDTPDPGPEIALSPFDVLTIQDQPNPGIVTITGAERPYRIDVQAAPGQKGNLIFRTHSMNLR